MLGAKENQRRTLIRILVAAIASATVDALVWSMRTTHLSGHIDIVGNSTFSNFNSPLLFLKYRLITYAFPAGVIVFYLLLGLRGPLRTARRPPKVGPVALLAHDRQAVEPGARAESRNSVGSLWALVAPAVFLGLVSTVPLAGYRVHVTALSFLFAGLYVVVVLAAAWCVHRGGRRLPGLDPSTFASAVALVSAPAVATVAIGGVWFISHNARVVLAHGETRHWAWLPWWLAGLCLVGAWGWIVRDLRRREAADKTEHRVRVVLLGCAAMYLIVAGVPLARGYFQGYDDAIGVTGAHLAQHGYFPWRDFLPNHGLFPDVFISLFGFKLFGETAWGSDAGIQLVLVPIAWIGMYLLGAWALRRRSLWVIAPLVFAASHLVTMDPRFIAFPFVLLLFGKELSMRRLPWTFALTVALFAEAVCVPEADYQVLAVLVVVVASDFVHRRAGDSLRVTFRRTVCVVITGALLMLAFMVFLASQHALGAFVDWFRIFIPGHDYEGALNPSSVAGSPRFMFRLMMVLVVVSVLWAAWQLRERANWTPRGWVIVAAAINAGLYGEQALGRFDVTHVIYSLTVALCLMALLAAACIPEIDAAVSARFANVRLKGRVVPPIAPITCCLTLLAIIGLPVVTTIWHVGSQDTAILGAVRTDTKLGYSDPAAFANGLLPDLRKVLDTYGPRNAPFFDMTNAEGYFYYLLGRRPASPFVNVSMAMTEYAQELLVKQLSKSRPPLIAYNTDGIGLPAWDGVQNQVRSFIDSQYILDHWTPIIEAQGVLFLLRNDLLKHRPPVPHLSQPPVTTDLYSSAGACNWGDAANFLESQPSGRSVSLHADRLVDHREVSISGWSFDPKTKQVPKQVFVVIGHQLVAWGPIFSADPSIGARFHSKAAAASGFVFNFATTVRGPISLYVVTADNAVHPVAAAGFDLGKPLPRVPLPRVVAPGGAIAAVRSSPIGSVTVMTSNEEYVSRFTLPPGNSLPGFDLATFASAQNIGDSQLTLSQDDGPDLNVPGGTDILANTLPVTGSKIAVRVGSCLTWHGYAGRTLYVGQMGGNPITKLELSGVRS